MDFKKREKLEGKSKDHLINIIFELNKEIQKLVKDQGYYSELRKKYEDIEKIKEDKKSSNLEKLKHLEDISENIKSVIDNDYPTEKEDVSEIHVMNKSEDGAALIITAMTRNGFKQMYFDINEISDLEEDENKVTISFYEKEQVILEKGEKNYYIYNPQTLSYIKVDSKKTYDKYMETVQEAMQIIGK